MYEDIQLRRAFLSVTLSQFKDAIPIFREALSFNLENEDRNNALAGLGRCYCETHDWGFAKECLGQALKYGLTKEYERQSHFFFGMACFYADDLIEAKREFEICEERIAEFDLSIVDVYRWLSVVSGRLGETAEAERYARLAKIV
jgi:tetratricopeptide (TPR) repeat protein